MRPLFLQGHQRPLTWVTFNRDGDLLFTAAKDAKLTIWRTEDGQRIGTYPCEKGVIWACDCSLDSTTLVAASADLKVMIFDVETGKLIHEIKEAGPCKFVEWNQKPDEQNKFVIAHNEFGGQSSKAIKVWTLNTPDGKPKRLWSQEEYMSRCTQVHWGPYDKHIISAHENGDIMIWNAETGEYVSDFKAHKRIITCVSFNEHRTLMLTCCSDGSAKLWETINFKCLKTYQTDRPLNACSISPRYNAKGNERRPHILLGGGQAAEEVTVTGASEGKFQGLLYHMIHKDEIGSISGHFGPINTLAWMPNGSGYVSGGEDGYVRLYKFDEDYNTEKFS